MLLAQLWDHLRRTLPLILMALWCIFTILTLVLWGTSMAKTAFDAEPFPTEEFMRYTIGYATLVVGVVMVESLRYLRARHVVLDTIRELGQYIPLTPFFSAAAALSPAGCAWALSGKFSVFIWTWLIGTTIVASIFVWRNKLVDHQA
jgi:hypothetical protein